MKGADPVAKKSMRAHPMPRHDLDALGEDFRAWNARQRDPLQECASCHHPTLPGDFDPYFPDLCGICGARSLDDIIRRVVDRLGRKRAIAALKELAESDRLGARAVRA